MIGVHLKGKTSIANKSILWLAPSMGATLTQLEGNVDSVQGNKHEVSHVE